MQILIIVQFSVDEFEPPELFGVLFEELLGGIVQLVMLLVLDGGVGGGGGGTGGVGGTGGIVLLVVLLVLQDEL